MKRSYFFVLFCLFGFSGCGTGANPHISMEPPVYVEEMPSRVQGGGVGNLGSLFGKGDNPLFSDRKAMNVNDIVTVIIEENDSLDEVYEKIRDLGSSIDAVINAILVASFSKCVFIFFIFFILYY